MAWHLSKNSMKFESLLEILEVAEYCVNFDKSKSKNWAGWQGCYGYPAALLLLSIVDGVGAHIEGGGDDTKQHFKILNNPKWYNLNLSDEHVETLRKGYRNKLNHENILGDNLVLNLGDPSDEVIISKNEYTILNLKAFLVLTKKVISKLLPDLKLKIII
ncbi:MAG: hypothetical protein WD898_02195 [Candidatus Paceibacterota bacterium]